MIVLRGITWEHARGFDCMVAASAEFATRTPGVRVDWDYRSLQEFADAPLERLVERYDLLVIDHPHVPTAAASGLLLPLDGVGFDDRLDALAAQSVGRSHGSYQHAGHQWGLASDAAAQVSASRPDLISEPPTTWDEVLALAAEGRVVWPAKPIDAFSSLITIAGAFGAVPVGEPGTFLDEAELGAVLDVMHRLAEAVPPENLAQNPIDVAETLAASDRACYSPLLFGYTNYSRVGYRQHRLRYRDVPAGPAGIGGSLLGGAGVAVSARTAHPDAARAFAIWVAEAEAQRGVYFDGGGQPGNALAWEDDRLDSETDGFFRGTRRTLELAYLRPRVAGFLAFQDRMAESVTAALRNEISDGDLHRRLESAAVELLLDTRA